LPAPPPTTARAHAPARSPRAALLRPRGVCVCACARVWRLCSEAIRTQLRRPRARRKSGARRRLLVGRGCGSAVLSSVARARDWGYCCSCARQVLGG
jgi:hypothetical protein